MAERLLETIKTSGIDYCLLAFSYGDMAPEHAERSLDLFISGVMPAIRAELG